MAEEGRPWMQEPGAETRHLKSRDCEAYGCQRVEEQPLVSDDSQDAAIGRWLMAHAHGSSLTMDGTQYWHFDPLRHKTRTVREAILMALTEEQGFGLQMQRYGESLAATQIQEKPDASPGRWHMIGNSIKTLCNADAPRCRTTIMRAYVTCGDCQRILMLEQR